MTWETVMGLEVHVELATKSKIFCSCTTEFGGEANTHCCPICTGMPGTLPVLNEKVLEFALKAGIALNCDITRYNKFDRKNYFYPDLPKAYQISQLYFPFAKNGKVEITTKSGEKKTIGIHEIHMEEDAGKLIHSPFGDATYADYNRCGVPLIEIVSEPDFRGSDEVIAYLEQVKSTLEYLGVSDCKMQEGSMRADVNLSVRPVGSKEFGTRTEMKNINSFKAIEHAIEFETKRQIELLESGGRVVQQTRRWDDNKSKSYAMRSKENAQDYRYFPEPDIPPISVSEERLAALKAEQPELAGPKKLRYIEQFGLSDYHASIITLNKNIARIFEQTAELCGEPKEVCNWIIGNAMYLINERSMELGDVSLSPRVFAEFIKAITSGKINKSVGKTLFEVIFDSDDSFDIDKYIADNQLAVIDDDGAIYEVVQAIISANPQSVEQYKEGKTKVMAFFVGQCMRQLKGKANPDKVNKIIVEELAKQ
ncbi:MAG: Asp-tRNA(Asn)/Glu-tRNA(Gln) amidotransferase subunit GatB [Oscillospiraceae bacterium]|jgi:aspartyl-tRNA(Asn)/glutamyl-tRNA(Gln) amidotransferase subunit B|nr:Asp-tRNA(Asn)/Glu-tRNA(Gln) amidotransferase subunit GatB [Oscillospiraceae bacterium]